MTDPQTGTLTISFRSLDHPGLAAETTYRFSAGGVPPLMDGAESPAYRPLGYGLYLSGPLRSDPMWGDETTRAQDLAEADPLRLLDAVHREVYGRPAPGMALREGWQIDPERARNIVQSELHERLGAAAEFLVDPLSGKVTVRTEAGLREMDDDEMTALASACLAHPGWPRPPG